MNILNNIVKKSLVEFPIPKREDFINDIEMLDYFGNIIPIYDAHLGIDFCPKEESLPVSKYNSNGYCYIYLDGLNIVDRDKYIQTYIKILLKAKRDGYKKFVINLYNSLNVVNIKNNAQTNIESLSTEIFMPFYSEIEVSLFNINKTVLNKEDTDIKFKYYQNIILMENIRTGFIYPNEHSIKFKIPFDSLIIRTSTVNKPLLYAFYNDARVKIYYTIISGKSYYRIPYIIDYMGKSFKFLVSYRLKVFKPKKYKVFKTEKFPAKYLPNV